MDIINSFNGGDNHLNMGTLNSQLIIINQLKLSEKLLYFLLIHCVKAVKTTIYCQKNTHIHSSDRKNRDPSKPPIDRRSHPKHSNTLAHTHTHTREQIAGTQNAN